MLFLYLHRMNYVKTTKLLKILSVSFLAGALCLPLVGCGVESEPLGVDDPDAELEEQDEEYLEGEEGI